MLLFRAPAPGRLTTAGLGTTTTVIGATPAGYYTFVVDHVSFRF